MIKLIKKKKVIILYYVYYYDHQYLFQKIEIPERTYKIFQFAKEVQNQLPEFFILVDNNTMKDILLSPNYIFEFTKPCL